MDIYHKKKRIGEILIESGIISQAQLEAALNEQKKEPGVLLGNLLVKLGFTTEEAVAKALSRQLNIPFLDLQHYTIDPKVIDYVPENVARHYSIVPLFKIKNILTIAMSNPLDISYIDEIQQQLGNKIDIVISTQSMILKTIDNYYSAALSIKELIHDITSGGQDNVLEVEDGLVLEKIEEYPVVKLVNLIVAQAIKERASDIHIEPGEKTLRIRYRIDGALHEAFSLPKHLEKAIISRIKIMSGMNITERYAPQDGHIEMKFKDKIIDFRVATYPTISGECIAMRVLSRGGIVYGLKDLGVEPEMLDTFQNLVTQPHGLILTTGPTGSGKTTTLYAILNTINSVEKKIITIEDPVEYGFEGISQAQINPKAGITFAAGLRSILRQDPNIVMVGEIRDSETAQITIQAALTGHLVLSSLHTNDAASTVTRLIDMGIEPFLVASTLLCSISQRLIRALCPNCKREQILTKEERARLGLSDLEKMPVIYQASEVGCKQCNKTGYKGRAGIFEIMVPDEEIKKLIVNKSADSVIKQTAVDRGMRTLWQAGARKVLSGVTCIAEIMRVSTE